MFLDLQKHGQSRRKMAVQVSKMSVKLYIFTVYLSPHLPIHLSQIRRFDAKSIGEVALYAERGSDIAVRSLQTSEVANADACLLGQLLLGPSSFPPKAGDVEMEDKKVVVVEFEFCHFNQSFLCFKITIKD